MISLSSFLFHNHGTLSCLILTKMCSVLRVHEWSTHQLSYAYVCLTEDIMAPLSGLDLVQINGVHACEMAIPEELSMFDTPSLVF